MEQRAAGPAFAQVASFDQQVIGAAVSKDGRSFVNFLRWEKDVPISVAELTERGRGHLALHGFDVVGVARLEGVRNIYEETAERTYAVGK